MAMSYDQGMGNIAEFEDYKVDPELATGIRRKVQKIREQEVFWDLKTLVEEEGTKEKVDGELGFQELLNEKSALLFEKTEEIAELHPTQPTEKDIENRLAGIELERTETRARVAKLYLKNSELFVYLDRQAAFECIFLPKNKEYLVKFVDEELFEKAFAIVEAHIAQAKQSKRERQSKFKERFQKKTTA